MLGYTAVVGASKSKPVTGRKADVIHAAKYIDERGSLPQFQFCKLTNVCVCRNLTHFTRDSRSTSAEAALRLLRPDKTNFDITDTVQKICVDTYGCIPVEGILSSQLRRTVVGSECDG